MKRIRKVERLQQSARTSRIPPKGWHEHPRLFSFAFRNFCLWNGGVVSRSQAQLSTEDPSVSSPTKLRDAMPPRSILDMKLGGSGSVPDGHGHVGVSSFLTRIDQLLRHLLWRVWMLEDARGFFVSCVEISPRRALTWPQPICITMMYPFWALKPLLIRNRSSHVRIRDMKVYPQANIVLRTA
jgi:hypothetical protein